jgi:hypothetical protein
MEASVSDAPGRAPRLLREVVGQIRTRARALRAAFDTRVERDLELERLAERAFGELRQAPQFRPSHDIGEVVKLRLQQWTGASPASGTDTSSDNDG